MANFPKPLTYAWRSLYIGRAFPTETGRPLPSVDIHDLFGDPKDPPPHRYDDLACTAGAKILPCVVIFDLNGQFEHILPDARRLNQGEKIVFEVSYTRE